MRVGGVLLAAGAGRRFGGPKALATFRGQLLLERGLRTLRDGGCDPVVVVLGPQAQAVLRSADLEGARPVLVTGASGGIAMSLRAGLAALMETDAEAAVVALVDQPLVTPAALERLRAAWRSGATAAACTYGGVRRNPVLFDRAVWSDVARAVTGDVGGRSWLDAHAGQVTAVPCDGVSSPDDVDTPEDLERLQ